MKTTVDLKDGRDLDPPARSDGEPWPLMMFHGDGLATFADTYTELVGELIPDYDDIPDTDEGDEEALWQRYQQAVAIAGALQEGFVQEAIARGALVVGSAGEDVLTALLSEKTTPFVGIPDEQGRVTMEWTHDCPLVLIESDYEPFTDVTTPSGRIVWIRPVDEKQYIASLAEAQIVAVAEESSDDPEIDELLDEAG